MTKIEVITPQKIQNIISDFDFEKVHAYMKLTKWVWATETPGETETPSIEKLKTTAEYLLIQLYRKHTEENISSFSMGTGGFMVYLFEYGFRLTFELESKSNF